MCSRVFVDAGPPMQIYGKEKTFDADRLIDVLEAYSTFKVASQSSRGDMVTTLEAKAPASTRPSGNGRLAADAIPIAGPASQGNGAWIAPSGDGLPGQQGDRQFALPGLLGSMVGPVLGMGWADSAELFPRFGALQLPSSSSPLVQQQDAAGATEALKFVLAPEGAFFREFVLNELVVSIDAMSRTQLQVSSYIHDLERSQAACTEILTSTGGSMKGCCDVACYKMLLSPMWKQAWSSLHWPVLAIDMVPFRCSC